MNDQEVQLIFIQQKVLTMAGLKFECNCKDIRQWILHTLSTVFIVTSLTTKFTFDFSDINIIIDLSNRTFLSSFIITAAYLLSPQRPELWILTTQIQPAHPWSPVIMCVKFKIPSIPFFFHENLLARVAKNIIPPSLAVASTEAW